MSQSDFFSSLTEMMQKQFGLRPRGHTCLYRKPYLDAYDQIEFPPRFKVPDFHKFTGTGNTSTVEHISHFLAQCGLAAVMDAWKIRLFPLSLAESAFGWFSALPANSIITWADLEEKFHKYFFAGVHELKITDLMAIKQRNDESVSDYLQRFRNTRS